MHIPIQGEALIGGDQTSQ